MGAREARLLRVCRHDAPLIEQTSRSTPRYTTFVTVSESKTVTIFRPLCLPFSFPLVHEIGHEQTGKNGVWGWGTKKGGEKTEGRIWRERDSRGTRGVTQRRAHSGEGLLIKKRVPGSSFPIIAFLSIALGGTHTRPPPLDKLAAYRRHSRECSGGAAAVSQRIWQMRCTAACEGGCRREGADGQGSVVGMCVMWRNRAIHSPTIHPPCPGLMLEKWGILECKEEPLLRTNSPCST